MKKIIVCFMTLAAFIANAQKKAATDQKGFTYIHDLDYDEKVTHMLEDQHGNYTFLCVKTNVDSMLRIVRVDLNGKLKADIKKTNLAMRDFQHATHDQQGCLITGYRRYNEDKNTYTSRIIKYSPDFSSVVFDTVYRNFTLSGIHPVDSLCCIVTGTFYPQNIFSGIEINGHEVYIVMKIDARGRIKWVESFGTPGMCEGSDIAISPTNDMLIASHEVVLEGSDHHNLNAYLFDRSHWPGRPATLCLSTYCLVDLSGVITLPFDSTNWKMPVAVCYSLKNCDTDYGHLAFYSWNLYDQFVLDSLMNFNLNKPEFSNEVDFGGKALKNGNILIWNRLGLSEVNPTNYTVTPWVMPAIKKNGLDPAMHSRYYSTLNNQWLVYGTENHDLKIDAYKIGPR